LLITFKNSVSANRRFDVCPVRGLLFKLTRMVTGTIFFLCAGVFAQADAGTHSLFMAQAAEIAASLDDSTLAAQVLLTGIDGKAALSPDMKALLGRIPAGGIMLFKYNLDTPKDDVKALLSEAASLVAGKAGIPPFMAVDHEGGLVHRFGPGITKLPSAFSFWELAQKEGTAAALARAEMEYSLSAGEIRGLGITLVLGPVAEKLDNDNRLFLDTRSYGSDPDFTRDAALAFIKSMDSAGIACAVKHFPGNTAADPHSGATTLKADKAALDDMVKPFAEIIRSFPPAAVMVSHVKVPAVDNKTIASLSPLVIRGWLRGELGFEGIVLADDFIMAAVSAQGIDPAAAAVEALNAGVDMIMTWPRNISAVHAAVLQALGDCRLTRSRLREAACRIIAAKIQYGLLHDDLLHEGVAPNDRP